MHKVENEADVLNHEWIRDIRSDRGEEELSADQPNPSRFCSSTELLAMIGGVKETFYASSVSTQLPFWIWVQRSEWIQTNPRVGC